MSGWLTWSRSSQRPGAGGRSTLAGELAQHDRAVFERASASPAMIRVLVESLADTDVRSRLADVAVPALVLHRRSDFVPLATGCPWLEDRVLGLGGQPHRPPAPEPGIGPIAPRRTVLDPILLTAAAQAGVHVEMGVSVHGLLRQGERVTGVATSAGQRRARLVIGADGRNSRIARLARAKTYHDHPPVTFGYYTYWRGCLVTGVHAWLEPGRFFGIFPVGGGLALAFVQGPRGEYPTFRRDPLAAYVSELRSRPALAGLLGDAVIAERLRETAALPTFFRISSGPGWALAGDAGHHKDPVIARGIADAFRDADLLAAAVMDGWHGDLEAALAEYGRQRDRCAIPLSDANLGIARLDMATAALGAAWFQLTGLEQALDNPAAVSD